MNHTMPLARVLLLCATLLGLGACQTVPQQVASDGAPARVALLQSPAWLERDGLRYPLQPGAELESGDWIITGSDGRVHIEFRRGAQLRLGGETRLELTRAQGQPSARLHQGTLRHVGETGLDLSVAGLVAARMRGGDSCARAEAKRVVVCAAQGEVEVEAEGGGSAILREPRAAYVVPHGAAPQQETAGKSQIAGWLSATDPVKDRPMLKADGSWGVGLIAQPSPAQAQDSLQQVWAKGYPARRMEVESNGRQFHRIAVIGFDSSRAARGFVPIAETEGFVGAWVFRHP